MRGRSQGKNAHKSREETQEYGVKGKGQCEDNPRDHRRLEWGEMTAVIARDDDSQPAQKDKVRDIHEEGSRTPLCDQTTETRQPSLHDAAYANSCRNAQQHQSAALNRRVKAPEEHGWQEKKRA